MKARDFEARRLDVKAFAKAGGELSGSWSLAGFERLRDALVAGDDAAAGAAVRWRAVGREQAVRSGSAESWLQLHLQADLPMLCQRCLLPSLQAVRVERQIQFVPDENSAAELDAQCEHDVLVLAKELDLHQLVEDELLLDLPVVPRHDRCPEPLPVLAEPADEPAQEHPFSVLAGLRLSKD